MNHCPWITGRLCTTIQNRVDTQQTTILKDKFHFSFKTTCTDRVSKHIQVCMAVSERASSRANQSKMKKKGRSQRPSTKQQTSNQQQLQQSKPNYKWSKHIGRRAQHSVAPSLSLSLPLSHSFSSTEFICSKIRDQLNCTQTDGNKQPFAAKKNKTKQSSWKLENNATFVTAKCVKNENSIGFSIVSACFHLFRFKIKYIRANNSSDDSKISS